MNNCNLKLALINTNRYNQGDTIPMGLLCISSYLKKYSNINNIKLFDLNFDDIYSEIQKFNPDLVGISAMTIDYSKAVEIATNIKKIKETPILIGGPHISTLPSSFHKSFDIGVLGEGEETMLELIKLYSEHKKFLDKDLKKIKGIIFHNGNEFIITEKREPITPLDKIPMIDKTLIPKPYLRKRTLPNGNYGILAPLLTGRGCPFNCVFCSTRVMWGNKVRFNSPERVVEEIKDYVRNYNAKYLNIWDDLFANKKRINELIEVFKKEKINLSKEEKKNFSKKEIIDIPISCQLRIDLVDDEMCELLKQIGVVKVGFGFESGSSNYLNYLKKGKATLEQTHNAIKICKKHELLVSGSLIFGGPYETIEDMKKTLELIDFMIKNDVENVWSFVMTPFPGTEIWNIAKERGKVNDLNMDWDSLSHQNVDDALLLENTINKEEFKRIFWESRKKQKYFKWKKIKYEMTHHPIVLFKNFIKKPGLGIKLLFGRQLREN